VFVRRSEDSRGGIMRRMDAAMKYLRKCAIALALLLPAGTMSWAEEVKTTIVYDDVVTSLDAAQPDAGQLWITTADLKRATRFELKPQGVCRHELCFPLPKRRESEFLQQKDGTSWFNLMAFARQVQQPVARDESLRTWYFGLRADQRQGLAALLAPDFTLPDVNGKKHSLSEFRGQKILLVTWASW